MDRLPSIEVAGREAVLLPEKALWLPEYRTLVVSDVHLGKANHFRKHGLATPAQIEQDTYHRLATLLHRYAPGRVVFLGDLFHSTINDAWEPFTAFFRSASAKGVLIKGNHDILPPAYFAKAGLEIQDEWILGPFCFTHDAAATPYYNVHGHVHPAVLLRGAARSSLRLPCFVFGESRAILPSFGAFTGSTVVKPAKGERVFVVGNGAVYPV